MKNLLNTVKVPQVRKSFFDMSFEHKTTFDMFDLIPISAVPVVPTDRVTIGVDSLLRTIPLLAPLMHLVNVYTHTFFVPYRILWKGTGQNNRWNDFIANIKTLGVLPSVPTIAMDSTTASSPGTLSNYLGIPPLVDASERFTAFNWAAYQCIYNEYYRDQNLSDEVSYLLTDGSNDANAELKVLRKRAWEKDYFTASLPWAQKGDAVTIPLAGDAPIRYNTAVPGSFIIDDDTIGSTDQAELLNQESDSNPPTGLFADLSDTSATTINDLRLAYTLQRWYEQLARGGTRPNEFLKVMFNIESKDARLQRPEYICGSKSPFAISEVLNTTGSFEAGDPDLPTSGVQGSMAGHGVGVTRGKQGSFYVEEFGVIMTIMSVIPKSVYFEGIPKQYSKNSDPTEYYMPTFDHLGEQEVKNKEVQGGHANKDGTFGYIPRYAEYKVPVNMVSGEFQESLLFWHLARKFGTEQNLNNNFVEGQPDFRIFAVEDSEHQSLLASVWNDIKIVRPMSKYSTPTF